MVRTRHWTAKGTGERGSGERKSRRKTTARRNLLQMSIASCLHCQTLEGKVQRHLQETRTADGVLDKPELPRRGTDVGIGSETGMLVSSWKGIRGRWAICRRIGEEGIEFDVIVWSVKARVIENIEGLQVKLQSTSIVDPEILEESHIHAGLK